VSSTQQQARAAGFLYLLLALIAPIGLLYVPGKLIVSRNATATADNIRASEWILRIGIASELIHQIIGVFLVLALYRLFKAVNETHAKQMVILGALVSVPIVFVNVLNEIAALILVRGADFLSVFEKPQLDALAYLFLRLHGQGITVASIFWGLWLFPFGMLVIRSGFIPPRARRPADDRRERLPGQLLRHPDPAAVCATGFEGRVTARGRGAADRLLALDLGREDASG
jgi:hypothetical protein